MMEQDSKQQNQDPRDKIAKAAEEATKFVQKHPWLALAGALAVGYLLGSVSTRRRPELRK